MDELKTAAEAMGAEVRHYDYSKHLKGLPPLKPIRIKLTEPTDAEAEHCERCSQVATEEDCASCPLLGKTRR